MMRSSMGDGSATELVQPAGTKLSDDAETWRGFGRMLQTQALKSAAAEQHGQHVRLLPHALTRH